MLDLNKIGKRIKILRVKKDLTQSQLAKAIGCPQAKISDWEKGKLLVSTTYLYQLSNFFGVYADYLMEGKTVRKKKAIEV